MQALVAGGRAEDTATIEGARKYLADHLLDEGEGIAKDNKFYGGIGYGGTSDGGIADIISLELGLRAMKEADLPANDPAWQKAIQFLQRTQNHQRDQRPDVERHRRRFRLLPWLQSDRRHDDLVRQRHVCGHSELCVGQPAEERPPRAECAASWIGEHYTVDENPGIGAQGALLLLHGVREGAAGRGRQHHRRRQGRGRTTGARTSAASCSRCRRRRATG